MTKNDTIADRAYLLSCYKDLVEKLERAPYASEFYEEYGCQYAVRKHFGSWNTLVKSCDLKFNRVTGTGKEELVERVLKLAKGLGRTPTRAEFNRQSQENNLCSAMVVQRYFGTWTKCIEFCKLEPVYRRKGK